jgi:hypothetical protein
MRHTHTFVTLPVSQATYNEIAAKLKAAAYGHCFIECDGETVIDMSGIALEIDSNVALDGDGGSGK